MTKKTKKNKTKNDSKTLDEDGDVGEDDIEELDNDQINNSKGYNDSSNVKKTSRSTTRYITPEELRSHLRVIFENESEICDVLYGSQGILFQDGQNNESNENDNSINSMRPQGGRGRERSVSADIFFMDVIAIPPTRFRPASLFNDVVMENPQNEHLTKVLKIRHQFCNIAANLEDYNKNTTAALSSSNMLDDSQEQKKKPRVESLIRCWIDLQDAVNGLIDNSKASAPYGKVPTPGIKQILEKKEGLFRKHLMVT